MSYLENEYDLRLTKEGEGYLRDMLDKDELASPFTEIIIQDLLRDGPCGFNADFDSDPFVPRRNWNGEYIFDDYNRINEKIIEGHQEDIADIRMDFFSTITSISSGRPIFLTATPIIPADVKDILWLNILPTHSVDQKFIIDDPQYLIIPHIRNCYVMLYSMLNKIKS